MIRPVLVNSIPKAGTHLVSKALTLIPGVTGDYVRLAPTALEPCGDDETVDVGIGLPRSASARRVREVLAGLQPGQFALWHVPYSPKSEAMLRELDLVMVIMVRDPRDVVVSHAFHIAHFRGHRLHARFREMSTHDQLAAVIEGMRDDDGALLLEPLADRYAHLLAWRRFEPVHLVRFEDLVGTQGGGDAAEQRRALRDLLLFLGVPATDDVIDRITANLFGETVTFRKGRVGGWREQLCDAHVASIERSCGAFMRDLGYEQKHDGGVSPSASRRVPPFIVNSSPKSGTKLLCKMCAMLPGVAPLPINPRWRALSMMPSAWLSAPAVGTAGSKPERPTSNKEVAELLEAIPHGRFIEHHIAYSPELAALLRERGVRMLMMVRDPRDAVVSLADYLARAAHHPLHGLFSALPAEERIVRAIVGVRSDETGGPTLSDVGTRYRRRLGWVREPGVCVIRFEDLVGPAGGGDEVRQRDAIERLLAHLEIEPTPALVEQLASTSFGGTRTFQHGRIGRWRDVFTAETRALFAELAGDILKELDDDAEPT